MPRGTTEQALRDMYDLLSGALGLRMGLTVVLETALKRFGVDAACVLLFDRHPSVPHYTAGAGFQTLVLRRSTSGGTAGGAAARATGNGEVAMLGDDAIVMTYLPDDQRDRFEARYAWPMIADGRLLGALQVLRRSPVKPDAAWRTAMDALAVQLAASINEARRAGSPIGPGSPSRN